MSTVSTRLAIGVVIAVSTLGLAGCGSNTPAADPGGVADLGDTTETTTAPDGAVTPDPGEAPTDPNEAYVLYDRCMTGHGFPTDAAGVQGAPDQSPISVSGNSSSDGPHGAAIGPGGIEIPPDQIEAFLTANEVCQAHLANVVQGQELTPEQQAAMADANLRMQQCMNDKGFGGQFSVSGDGTTGGVTTNEESNDGVTANTAPPDPAEFEAAMKECAKVFDDYPELTDVPAPGRD